MVNQVKISPESKQIYLLLDNERREVYKREIGIFAKKQEITGSPELMTLNMSPLEVNKELSLGKCPLTMYLVAPERAVIICQDYRRVLDANDRKNDFIQTGTIKIINPVDNSLINEYETAPMPVYRRYYKDDQVLILDYFVSGSVLSYGKEFYVKITPTEIKVNEFKEATGNFEYLADKNRLYIITSNNLAVIDYTAGTTNSYKTGFNGSYTNGSFFEFYRLPETDIAIIYKFEKSTVKFFDLNENRMVKKVSCGRRATKAFNSMIRSFFGHNTLTETTVSISPDKTKYFIFNRKSDDITVYGRNFEKQTYIVVKGDTCIGMYLIKKPALQTVVITKKKINRLDYDNNALIPIYEFKESLEGALLFSDDTRTIVLSDKEIIVLDSQTLEVKNNFTLLTNKTETYNNIKAGDQRYYFIPSL